MESQKIYLLAELTVLPEFLDDVKGELKQALIPTLQQAGCEGMFETSREGARLDPNRVDDAGGTYLHASNTLHGKYLHVSEYFFRIGNRKGGTAGKCCFLI